LRDLGIVSWSKTEQSVLVLPHCAEVAEIQSQNLAGPPPLGHGKDRCIDEAQGEIPITGHELAASDHVSGRKVVEGEGAGDKAVYEIESRGGAKVPSQKVVGFGNHGQRDDNGSRVVLDNGLYRSVVPVPSVIEGIETTGLCDQRHAPGS
jgi:hypothetical protein